MKTINSHLLIYALVMCKIKLFLTVNIQSIVGVLLKPIKKFCNLCNFGVIPQKLNLNHRAQNVIIFEAMIARRRVLLKTEEATPSNFYEVNQ